MDFTEACYHASQSLARVKQWDLGRQLFRAAVSVPSNIAEGHGRGTARDFAHFLDMSMGSLGEVDTLVELSFRVHLIRRATSSELLGQAAEVGRILSGLRKSKRAIAAS